MSFDLSIQENLELVKTKYSTYISSTNFNLFQKMYDYYKGNTDAMANYKMITDRSNLKVNLNYIKKFIKEEVSYSVGNPIIYESRSSNKNFIDDIDYILSSWSSNHDSDLMKYLLIFAEVYELYYIDEDGDFSSKILKPTEGFGFINNDGDLVFFINIRTDVITQKQFLDVYTDDFIYHFDTQFNQTEAPTNNIFGKVPVSVGQLTFETTDDSLYKDLKGLQDAYETNLSDISNEISDFRNAYLKFVGAQIEKDQAKEMKAMGIIQMPEGGNAEWLIKNINDLFIQNTLDRYEDKMYQIACHINANEKMQSNTSSLALRARLNSLENKCSLNEGAHKDILKNRIKFLCKFLSIKQNKNYDPKDIKIKYTANIPQDDLMMAQIFSQTPAGTISKQTARAQFTFVDNPVKEGQLCEQEQQEELDTMPPVHPGV